MMINYGPFWGNAFSPFTEFVKLVLLMKAIAIDYIRSTCFVRLFMRQCQ